VLDHKQNHSSLLFLYLFLFNSIGISSYIFHINNKVLFSIHSLLLIFRSSQIELQVIPIPISSLLKNICIYSSKLLLYFHTYIFGDSISTHNISKQLIITAALKRKKPTMILYNKHFKLLYREYSESVDCWLAFATHAIKYFIYFLSVNF